MRRSFSSIIQDAIEFRRYLHQHPEPTWQEFETAKTIQKKLHILGIKYKQIAQTGTIAYLAHDKKGKHIALRADIDALEMD